MAIRFTENHRIYWNHMACAFAAGDVLPGSELANYLLANGAPVEEIDAPAPAELPPPDPGAVPDGSVAVVLAWVGDDRDKATRALDTERAGKDRAGIAGPLTKLLEA